jgi:BirA family biotin operon repressor/biotin-[acetyl-CoA-carboxylase] ligase
MPDGAAKPPGPTRILACEELDSTNSEAMRRALAGETGPLWITAAKQTRGRGRSGRTWASPSGNLYATLLFKPGCPPALVHQLSLLAGVAVHDALRTFGAPTGLRLKWPNDVLVGAAKVAGVLSESIVGKDAEPLAMLGIGINLASSPADAGRPTTDLSAHGLSIASAAALRALDGAMSKWLAIWDCGRAFAAVRAAWLERAGPSGEELVVNAGSGRVEGRFAGLDPDGSLLLTDPDGRLHRFSFGDVTVTPQLSKV